MRTSGTCAISPSSRLWRRSPLTSSATTYATAEGEDDDLLDHAFAKIQNAAWKRALATTATLIGQDAKSSGPTVATVGAAVGNAKKEKRVKLDTRTS